MSESNSNTSTPQSFLSWLGFRVMGAWLSQFISELWTETKNTFVNALAQSAFAANNAINVGMTETAEVLNPMLAQPSTEQIYTTQPQWDFEEGESLQLGSTWTDTSVTPNKVYPIPSIIRDKGYDAAYAAWQEAEEADKPAAWAVVLQHQHVVFPVWQWDTTSEKYGFKPMPITYRHNCNYFGGGLDGFVWAEVATSGTWSGSNVQVTVNAYQKPGTFCRINGTDCGIVTAVLDNGDDTYTLTLGCLCGLVAAGTTISKVELYKPV